MKNIAITALALIALTSCSKESTDTQISNDPVAVTLTQGAITRTVGNTWLADDRIGVSMFQGGIDTPYNSQSNYEYKAESTASTSDFVAVGDDMYYPVDGSDVDIYAYYPYPSSLEENKVIIIDVSSGIESEVDLLRAKSMSCNKTSGAISLNFEHRLSLLTMSITRGDGVPSDATTYPLTAEVQGSYTRADYDFYGDLFPTTYSDTANIPVTVSSDGTTATVILIPQEMPTDAKVVFTIDGEQYTWAINGTTFTKGQDHAYAITIQQEGVDVSGCSIDGWGTSSFTGTGTAK